MFGKYQFNKDKMINFEKELEEVTQIHGRRLPKIVKDLITSLLHQQEEADKITSIDDEIEWLINNGLTHKECFVKMVKHLEELREELSPAKTKSNEPN